MIREMWDELSDQMHLAFSQMVRKAAFDIQANAQVNAPVDTGFLRNSIYTVTDEGSSYGKGGAGGELLPEIEPVAVPTEAYVAVGANYGIFVEYGTVHTPSQPYLTPSVDKVRESFQMAIERLESHLRGLP
jgi:HK97 gp10 family phage protein